MIERCLPSMRYQIFWLDVVSDLCQGCAYVARDASHCNIVLYLAKFLIPQVFSVLHLTSLALLVLNLFLMLVVLLLLYLTSLLPLVWYLLFDGSGTPTDVSDRSLPDARV